MPAMAMRTRPFVEFERRSVKVQRYYPCCSDDGGITLSDLD